MSKKKIATIDKKPELTIADIGAMHSFYEAYYRNGVNIRFDKLKVVNLLRDLGFYRYDIPGTKQSELVRIVDNKIRLVTRQQVTDAFEDYLWKITDIERTFHKQTIDEDGEKIMEPFKFVIDGQYLVGRMYDNLQKLFSPDLMERLRPLNTTITINEDDKHTKYLFFNNVALSITSSGTTVTSYADLQDYIWDNSIINRDFTRDDTVGDFETFIGDICKFSESEEGKNRKRSLMSIMGYLMHNNYETNLKAAMFTDVNEEGAEIANGGTGKGILGKALAQMMNRERSDCRYLVVPGKGFEFKDTRYAGGDLTTQLIHIEDLDKHFSFNDLFCDITDGCIFRKLHQNPIMHFAKIMLSVNHTINFQGSSEKRRLVIFELYNYYSEKFTPVDKFGKRFFESEWTEKDWNQFYTFMIRCVEVYMKYGIIEPEMVNYENRLIEEQLPEDFTFFFENEIKEAATHMVRAEFVKKNMYDRFILKYPQYAKYNQNGFTKWCTTYLQLKHIRSAANRKRVDGDYTDIFVIYPDPGEKMFKYIVQ